MSESATLPVPYSIQSRNTILHHYKPQDKVDQEVITKPPVGKEHIPPPHAAVTLDPPIRGPITLNVHIQGPRGLFVSLKGNKENTKLTWSNVPYPWNISLIGPEVYVVTPGDGADLYWI